MLGGWYEKQYSPNNIPLIFLFKDEILQAEICTPSYTSSCGPFKVRGTQLGEQEKCVTVSRTVCTQAKGQSNMTKLI